MLRVDALTSSATTTPPPPPPARGGGGGGAGGAGGERQASAVTLWDLGCGTGGVGEALEAAERAGRLLPLLSLSLCIHVFLCMLWRIFSLTPLSLCRSLCISLAIYLSQREESQ